MAQLGGSNTGRCDTCNDRVYPLEKLQVDGLLLHKQCFKCTHCKGQLSLSNFASVNGKLYCKTHYLEIFAQAGGKYSVFGDEKFKKKESGSYQPTNVKTGGAPAPSAAPAVVASPPSSPKKKKEKEEPKPRIATEDEDSERDNKKYRSLKERMKLYESNASGSPPSSPKAQSKKMLPLEKRSNSVSSQEPGIVNEKKEDEIISDDVDALRKEVIQLRKENKKLHSTVDQLRTELQQAKSELAVQVAKSLESDEWVCKLSKDIETLKSPVAKSAAKV